MRICCASWLSRSTLSLVTANIATDSPAARGVPGGQDVAGHVAAGAVMQPAVLVVLGEHVGVARP